MEAQGSGSLSFVIRIHRQGSGVRGHVINVGSGQGRVVTSVAEAAEFIEAQIGIKDDRDAEGGQAPAPEDRTGGRGG